MKRIQAIIWTLTWVTVGQMTDGQQINRQTDKQDESSIPLHNFIVGYEYSIVCMLSL